MLNMSSYFYFSIMSKVVCFSGSAILAQKIASCYKGLFPILDLNSLVKSMKAIGVETVQANRTEYLTKEMNKYRKLTTILIVVGVQTDDDMIAIGKFDEHTIHLYDIGHADRMDTDVFEFIAYNTTRITHVNNKTFLDVIGRIISG
jgi:hypothetical protein